jgi:N-acetylglucosaminyldiphosphoundecaprenol N-acetyl-beta-D-mannosaminyltransferase
MNLPSLTGKGEERPVRPVFGLVISLLAQDELIKELLSPLAAGEGVKLVTTVNVDHVVTLRTNPRFRAAYDHAWRITADGTPVYLYARAVGVPLRERVTGADLFAEMVERWKPARHRLFMLVSSEAVAARMTVAMAQRGYDERTLTIEVPPFGFERDADYSRGLTARIKVKRPTHLIMGVGAPKSEIWAHEHRDQLGDAIVLCVGAAVEFVTGIKLRSPRFMRRIGMEWLWRFGTEPCRLFHRYFIRSFGFVLAIIADQPRYGGLKPGYD